MGVEREAGIGSLVDALYKDLNEYETHVSTYCTPECPHYDPDTSCELSTLSPEDCRESELRDLARWLVAHGWERASSTLPVKRSSETGGSLRVVKRSGSSKCS